MFPWTTTTPRQGEYEQGRYTFEGTFVLEAQPHDSYIKARKLHPVHGIYPSYKCGFL